MKKDASIAELWSPDTKAWNLCFRRNLNDDEFHEWASLSHRLSSFSTKEENDKWVWSLDNSGDFSTGSLTKELASNKNFSNADLYRHLWKGPVPKKVKFFIWEVSHAFINTADVIQRKMSSICLSPNCCCLCKKAPESQIHLFSFCPYASVYWEYLQQAFGWFNARPGDICSLLISSLLGHPFKDEKKTLWNNFIYAFFWNTWMERNTRIFSHKSQNIHAFVESTTYL
ncbi:MAG: hypothetical protein Q8835_02940, partial [Sweet potato little leaf phytoplasma]|nr:hypothetical protein [Sweet potato little leaf phytoplasma]